MVLVCQRAHGDIMCALGEGVRACVRVSAGSMMGTGGEGFIALHLHSKRITWQQFPSMSRLGKIHCQFNAQSSVWILGVDHTHKQF